jgi:hypothetical protein
MKIILSLVFFFSSFVSLANCETSVLDQYNVRARVSVELERTLKAGEIYKIYRMGEVGPFEDDKLVFVSKGSIHSGWFSDAIFVDPTNCKIDLIREIASE